MRLKILPMLCIFLTCSAWGAVDLPPRLYEEGIVIHEVLDWRRSSQGDTSPEHVIEMKYRFWKYDGDIVTVLESSGGSREVIHRSGNKISYLGVVRGSPDKPHFFQSSGYNQGHWTNINSLYGVVELLYDLDVSRRNAIAVKEQGDSASGKSTEVLSFGGEMDPFSIVEFIGDRVTELSHYSPVAGRPILSARYTYGNDQDTIFFLPRDSEVITFMQMAFSDSGGVPLPDYDRNIQTHRIRTSIFDRRVPVESSIDEVLSGVRGGLEELSLFELSDGAFDQMGDLLKSAMHEDSLNQFLNAPERMRAMRESILGATRGPDAAAKILERPVYGRVSSLLVVLGGLVLISSIVWIVRSRR